MKVIFLDMDGVLNHARFNLKARPLFSGLPTTDKEWLSMIDGNAVARLDKIVRETGARIVISSNWRYYHDPEDMDRLLYAKGYTGAPMLSETPTLLSAENRQHVKFPKKIQAQDFGFPLPRGMSDYDYPGRAFEILAWIKDWAAQHPNNRVTQFVALDDIFNWHFMAEYHVGTDFMSGMLDAHVPKAIEILNGSDPKAHEWVILREGSILKISP